MENVCCSLSPCSWTLCCAYSTTTPTPVGVLPYRPRKTALQHLRSSAFAFSLSGILQNPPFAMKRSRVKQSSARSQMVGFSAWREVSVPFREGAFPAQEYLREVERVVKITFPDSSRISYLGDSTWRSHLKPITFFTISANPFCDIKVYYMGESLCISSDSLVLDFTGLPVDFKNLNLNFSLEGNLRVSKVDSVRAHSFDGWVALGLKVNLPPPLSYIPESVVSPVGDGILDRILGAMETALLAGLIRDYETWCRIHKIHHLKQGLDSPNPELYVSG